MDAAASFQRRDIPVAAASAAARGKNIQAAYNAHNMTLSVYDKRDVFGQKALICYTDCSMSSAQVLSL